MKNIVNSRLSLADASSYLTLRVLLFVCSLAMVPAAKGEDKPAPPNVILIVIPSESAEEDWICVSVFHGASNPMLVIELTQNVSSLG